jgi:predicted ribosomally synthesized peptide with SipW-like signal peptide
MSKVLFSSMAILALVAGLGAGGLVAQFTDIETSSGNVFSAGEGQDLAVNDENPWVSTVFEVKDVWPGDSGRVTLKLTNVSSDPNGAGPLDLQILNLVDYPGITTEPEPKPDLGELSSNLRMLIWFDDNNNGIYEPPGEVKIVEDSLYNIAYKTYDLGILGSLQTRYLGIAWSVARAVGNEIQGDRCVFDIQFHIAHITKP